MIASSFSTVPPGPRPTIVRWRLLGMAHAPVFSVLVCAIERWFPTGGWGLPNGLTSSGLTVTV